MRLSLTILLLATLVLSAYWVKCEIGLNLSPSVSLSAHFPFKYLRSDHIVAPGENAVLLDDSFDRRRIIPEWSGLWAREKDKVTQSYDSTGIRHSRCLWIKSESSKGWAYPHRSLIQVKPGDAFHFTGFAKIDGESCKASAAVETLDKDQKVINWSHAGETIPSAGGWTVFEGTVIVPDQVSYIRFRLSGSGAGDFRFDDVRFWSGNQTGPNNLRASSPPPKVSSDLRQLTSYLAPVDHVSPLPISGFRCRAQSRARKAHQGEPS